MIPNEISNFEKVFKSIPGIEQVEIEKHFYSEEDVKELDKTYFGGIYADLPIAMLRRSGGNIDKELLIVVQFTIGANKQGLNALEFLSWWVRDHSRSGDNIQIRSIGLPPIANNSIQLGKTLKFWLEIYIVVEQEDINLVLSKVSNLSESLQTNIKTYKDAF